MTYPVTGITGFWGLKVLKNVKEVIQPLVPERLPCYDFTMINDPSFGSALLAVRLPTLGRIIFLGVTGGVYNFQARIHRCMADQRLLAIPTSCRRVAVCNPN